MKNDYKEATALSSRHGKSCAGNVPPVLGRLPHVSERGRVSEDASASEPVGRIAVVMATGEVKAARNWTAHAGRDRYKWRRADRHTQEIRETLTDCFQNISAETHRMRFGKCITCDFLF